MDGKLGVNMFQSDTDCGEIHLIHSSHKTKRFAFSWCWWSAYGWENHQKGDQSLSEDMKLVSQDHVYKTCGIRIRNNLIHGKAVVRSRCPCQILYSPLNYARFPQEINMHAHTDKSEPTRDHLIS